MEHILSVYLRSCRNQARMFRFVVIHLFTMVQHIGLEITLVLICQQVAKLLGLWQLPRLAVAMGFQMFICQEK